MSTLPPLGLLVRANLLNQLTAKVTLASEYYTEDRFTAAITGLTNRQMQVSRQFYKGRLSVGAFQQQIGRLARHDVALRDAIRPEGVSSTPVDSMPVHIANAFNRMLLSVRCQLPWNADQHVKTELDQLLDPVRQRSHAREKLADAFWGGHLSDYARFKAQVEKQASEEAGEAGGPWRPFSGRQLKAMKDILCHVAQLQPAAEYRWGPEASVLAAFSSKMQAEADIGHAARVDAESAVQPIFEASTVEHVPATIYDEIATAFWGGTLLHDYPAFNAVICSAVQRVLANAPFEQASLPERRYRGKIEVLSFLRNQQPPLPSELRRAGRHWLDAHASMLEREAFQQLVTELVSTGTVAGSRNVLPAPDSPHGLPQVTSWQFHPPESDVDRQPWQEGSAVWSGGAFPMQDDEPDLRSQAGSADDSTLWTDGESDVDEPKSPGLEFDQRHGFMSAPAL